MNLSVGPGWDTLVGGDVSERPKELASKASVVQATVGSNPTVTARVALLEPPVSVPVVSTLPGRSPERHPSASSQVRWPSRRPPAFPSSAGLPGGNASFTVVRLSSRRLLALPTGMLALRTNACTTAQAHDRKASEPWERRLCWEGRRRNPRVELEPSRLPRTLESKGAGQIKMGHQVEASTERVRHHGGFRWWSVAMDCPKHSSDHPGARELRPVQGSALTCHVREPPSKPGTEEILSAI